MALRHLWFLFSLAAATVVAILSPDLMPSFIAWATGVADNSFDALFRNDDLLRVDTGIAVGALVLFLLFYMALTLFDGIGVALARRRLRSEVETTGELPNSELEALLDGYPGLAGPASAFVGALQDISVAAPSGRGNKSLIASPRPAHYYFGPHKTIHSRTYRWLFDPLPVLLVAVGTGLLMLRATSAMGQRTGPSLGETLEPQIVGLLLLTTSALLIYVLKRIALGVRYQQTVTFCDYMDSLYPTIGEIEHLNRLETITRDASKSVVSAVNGISKEMGRTLDAKLKDWQKASEKNQKDMEQTLVSGLEAALREPISSLTKASERTGKDIAVQSREALDAVLKGFLDGLQQNFGKQNKDLKSTLEETEKAAKEMKKAYQESLSQHHKSVQESLQAYAGSFGQTAASFESLQGAVENLLALTTPLLRQMISQQEQLLSAMEQDSASNKIIGRAASELSLAAQASRDTVEQFVTLAERLREASKAVGSSRNGLPARSGGVNDKELARQLRALKSETIEPTE